MSDKPLDCIGLDLRTARVGKHDFRLDTATTSTVAQPATLTKDAIEQAMQMLKALPPEEDHIDHVRFGKDYLAEMERYPVAEKRPVYGGGMLSTWPGMRMILDEDLPPDVCEFCNKDGKVMPSPYEDRVERLVSRWLGLHAQGQEQTTEQLCRDCPELLPEVRRFLGDLIQRKRLANGPVAGEAETDALQPLAAGIDGIESVGVHLRIVLQTPTASNRFRWMNESELLAQKSGSHCSRERQCST